MTQSDDEETKNAGNWRGNPDFPRLSAAKSKEIGSKPSEIGEYVAQPAVLNWFISRYNILCYAGWPMVDISYPLEMQ